MYVPVVVCEQSKAQQEFLQAVLRTEFDIGPYNCADEGLVGQKDAAWW